MSLTQKAKFPKITAMAKAGGCWTCRLRHVKCDEAPMACLQCTNRRIHCHGYGPKPSWMDGGEKERQERQFVKRAVSKNLKRKRKIRNRISEDRQDHQMSPLSSHYPVSEGSEVQGKDYEETLRIEDTPLVTCPTASSSTAQTPIDLLWKTRALTGISFPEPLPYDEANLLMHYLDHVFPMQYPYYSTRRQSRGWLLWLLSGNCHRDIELEFHTRALRELQDFIASFENHEFSPANENVVEILACGLALISFEVLKGSTSNWQPHLYATASIATSVQGNLTSSRDQAPTGHPDKKATAAIVFHLSVLLWIDILACVAAGKKPSLPYQEWLASTPDFDLSRMMGCHNWAMKAIGDLGILKDWKTRALAETQMDFDEFEKRRQRIEDHLEDGLETAALHDSQLSPQTEDGCLTRIFAVAALVHLQTLAADISPRPMPKARRRAVSRVMLEIRMAHNTLSTRHMLWPVCVAGCVADPDQRPFFEQLLLDVLSGTNGMIGNCGTALEIMRHCWKYQIERPEAHWDCGSTMEKMGICALLI
ncbi:hypothetical protein FDECE_5471 [Fusarium decemcellulare]|nr:hypothetical protein FDECE_5471 [Fusarium decemcellulare]